MKKLLLTSKWKQINLISILIVLIVFSLIICNILYDSAEWILMSNPILPDYLIIAVNGGNINLMCFLLAGLVPTLFLRIIKKYIISTICIILFLSVGLLLKDLITIYESFYPFARMI